ncbi:LapA family protein, partial [Pseudomonas aeruginosa]
MLWVKRTLMAVGLLVVALFMIVVALENRQSVSFELFGLATPDLPVVLYVALAFIAGGIIGMLISVPLLARAKVRLRSARSDLSRTRKELAVSQST